MLVFTKTTGYRHDSIPAGVAAIQKLGHDNGFMVTATADGTAFTPANLARFAAVVFLSTTGTVLDAGQQAAFEGYIATGGGYVGIHAASDGGYQWAWYGGLVGAWFASHPAMRPATVVVEDRGSASTAHLGAAFTWTDEWYNFRTDPRPYVHVLLRVDESTYTGGMMGDHPVTWCHAYLGGRSWYTALGHSTQAYRDPRFTALLLGGIRIATGAAPCRTA